MLYKIEYAVCVTCKGDNVKTTNHNMNMQETILHKLDIAAFAAEVTAEKLNNKLFSREEVAQKILTHRIELYKRELARLEELAAHVQKFGI